MNETPPAGAPESAAGLLLRCLPLLEDLVARAARRWHLHPEEAEDLLSEIQIKLLDQDGHALRSCRSSESLGGFLAVTVSRHLKDRRNREWGKWRPCAEARRHGPAAQLLDRFLTRDGLSLAEATMRLRRMGVDWSDETIAEIAARFPSRPRRWFDDESSLADRASDDPSPEQLAEAREAAELRDRALATIETEIRKWPVEDALLIKGWVRGRTLAEISRQLGLRQRSLYTRLDTLFRRLRTRLAVGAAERDEILHLLSSGRSDLESSSRFLEEIDENPKVGVV